MKNPNIITTFAAAHNLVVDSVKVDKMNKVIFSTSFVPTLCGSDIVRDGDKVCRIDVAANTAVDITPTTIAKEAKDALTAGNGATPSSVQAAIQFGLVKKIVMKVGDKGTSGHSTGIAAFAKSLGLVVTKADVAVQNDVIFQTQGVKQIAGLDVHDGKYFKLDTVANTATLIDPEGIAEQAQADLIKGKRTDLTDFAQNYNLITAVTMEVKGASDAS